MMKTFDITKLTLQDYQELNSAISRAAPKIRFWYTLPNAFKFLVNKRKIIKQTGATSDYDKLHENYFIPQNESSLRKIYLADSESNRFRLGNIIGLNTIDICVYNPKNALPKINVGMRAASLTQIDGLGWGNTYDARISFERGNAFLNEEDQDIAHRLGFIYTPKGILEIDSLSPSDFEIHKDRPRVDDSGNIILYCDNKACQRQVRNPILVVDKQTGGLYHSETCFGKDMKVKVYLAQEMYLAQEAEEFNLKPSPVRVSLEDALAMYKNGELQQSPTPKTTHRFRELRQWPEAAVLFNI